MKTLSSLLLAVALLISASPAQAGQNPSLLQLTSPKLGAQVKGANTKLTVSLSSQADRNKFKARLNGHDITTLFAPSGSCTAEACSESATISPSSGLKNGNNLVTVRVEASDGRSSFFQRSEFSWQSSNSSSQSASTKSISLASVSTDSAATDDTCTDTGSATDLLKTYAFRTLTPGGPQSGTAWFCISAPGVHPFARKYPSNGTDCSGYKYIVVAIDRTDFSEIDTECENTLSLDEYTSEDFVVVGTTAQNNADATLNTTAIGGTDFSKVDKSLAPAGYMAVGYGRSTSGSAPAGTALESYYISPSEWAIPSALPQVQGLLTLDVYSQNYFDINSSENQSFLIDAKKGKVEIAGQTYLRPDVDTTTPGFWLLTFNRRTLQVTSSCNSDEPYPQCGTTYTADDAGVSSLATTLTDNSAANQRNLLILTAWGVQPGVANGVSSTNSLNLAAALESLGGSRYSLDDMSLPTDAFVIVTSPDPTIQKGFAAQQVLTSNTANFVQNQTAQLTGTLARDGHYLYRPAYANIADLIAVPVQPGDPNLAVLAWSLPGDWPMMDTAGHIAAYQWLSNELLLNIGISGSAHQDDVRYFYISPIPSLLSLNPTDTSKYGYPGSDSFTQQDLADVSEQILIELQDLSKASNLLDIMQTSVIGDSENGAAFDMIAAVTGAVQDLNIDQQVDVSPAWSNMLNAAGAVAGIIAVVAVPETAPVYGLMSGSLWLAGSAGILDVNQNGIPTKDWNVLIDASQLSQSYTTYMQNSDAAFATIETSVYSDWNKLHTVSNAAQNQWNVQSPDDLTPLAADLSLGAKRYFYTSLFQAAGYEIDALTTYATSRQSMKSGAPSQMGATDPNDNCKDSLKWDENTTQGWFSAPAYPAQSGYYDVFFIGGAIHKNGTPSVSEDKPDTGLMATFFGPQTENGQFNLPKDMYFMQTLSQREPPAYQELDQINYPYNPGWCLLGNPPKTATFSNLPTFTQPIPLGTDAIKLSGTLSSSSGNYPRNGSNIYITIGNTFASTPVDDNTGDFGVFYTTKDLPAGTYTINYIFKGDANVGPTQDSSTSMTIGKGIPSFSGIVSPAPITAGTPSVTLSGKITAGSLIPTGEVFITILGLPQVPATINPETGAFSATINTQSLAASSTAYRIAYIYGGNSDFGPANNTATSLLVNAVPTTTVVISQAVTPWPVNSPGEIIFVSLRVNNDPTKPVTAGTVTLYDNGALVPIDPLVVNSSGYAETPSPGISFSSVGQHAITAAYSGAVGFEPATSGPMYIQVNKQNTGFSGLSTPAPINVKTPTITLQGTILDQNSNVPYPEPISVTIVNPKTNTTVASASFTTSATGFSGTIDTPAIPASTTAYSIVYTYAGDKFNNPATDATTTLTVNWWPSATVLTSSASNVDYGQKVTLTANVTGQSHAGPTGSVSYSDTYSGTTTVIGTDKLADGVAAISSTTLLPGDHTLTATYQGDNTYATSTSTSPASVKVNAVTPTFTVVASQNIKVGTKTINVSGTITAQTLIPTGNVTITVGNAPQGTATIGKDGSFQTTIDTSQLAASTTAYPITYSFAAAPPLFNAAQDNSTSLTVEGLPSTTTISSSLNPSTPGSTVTFTALVSGTGGVLDGTVQFLDGTTILGTIRLDGNTAPFTTNSLTAGSHTITAIYQGNSTFLSSQASLTQVVKYAPSFSNLTPSQTITVGTNSITVSGKIAAGTSIPTGTVDVAVGDSEAHPTIGADGSFAAILDTRRLPVSTAPYPITYSYAGSDAFNPAVDASTTLTVGLIATTTTITSSPNPSSYGSSVTFTATVTSNSGKPSGTVTFEDGSIVLGTATLFEDKADLTVSTLSTGTHAIVALYGGSASYQGSTSQPLSQQVNPLTPTFSGLTSHQITAGTSSLTVTGKIAAGTLIPTGTVQVSVNGTSVVPVNASISTADGSFSATLNTASVVASSTPYTISYSYAGSTNFSAATGTSTLTVTQAGAVSTTTTITASVTECITGTPFQFFITVTPTSQVNGVPAGLMNVERYYPNGQLDPTWQLNDKLDSQGQYNPDVNGTPDPIPAGTWTFVATYTPTDNTKFQPSSGSMVLTCVDPTNQIRRK